MSKRIGLREVRSLQPGEIVWDAAVPGFGARRQRGDAVAYVLKLRTNEGRQRWHTIGRHGAPWTPDSARDEARRLLGEVVKGADPSAEKRAKRLAETVSDLCDTYWAEVESGAPHDAAAGSEKGKHPCDRPEPDRRPHQAAPRVAEGGLRHT